VLHDLNLAARYADYLVALVDGRLHSAGSPEDILTAETVQQVFNIASEIIIDPTSGRPAMLPIGRHHNKRTTMTPHQRELLCENFDASGK
jgi:iron complex transport system ATP-binding protein